MWGWAQSEAKAPDNRAMVLKAGNNIIEIEQYNHHVRKVMIELPTDRQPNERLPVVFGFHGDGGPAEAYNTRLSPYVKKFRIISVSPQGELADRDKPESSFWNFLPGKRDWFRTRADDLNLVMRILALLDEAKLSDPSRIYATGGSSGGHMCNMLVKETHVFAAIAPTKCGMVDDLHKPDENTERIPIMWVMGDHDKSFNGGGSGEFVNYPVAERIKLWTAFDHCDPAAEVKTFPDMKVETYASSDGLEVVLCTLAGITHAIPSAVSRKTDSMILDFFMKHQKPPAPVRISTDSSGRSATQ